jgi:hypothetical protein
MISRDEEIVARIVLLKFYGFRKNGNSPRGAIKLKL